MICCIMFLCAAVCQDSIESHISCCLNGRNLKRDETIHYNYGDRSIVVCKVPKNFTIHVEDGVTNTSGMLKKIHDNFHVIGIQLNHAPDHIQLHTVMDNTISRGFRLNFEGKH